MFGKNYMPSIGKVAMRLLCLKCSKTTQNGIACSDAQYRWQRKMVHRLV